MNEIDSLLASGPEAVNVGVREFADSLAAQDVPVIHVDWTPPLSLPDDVAELLEALG
jgi:hypothetical protein